MDYMQVRVLSGAPIQCPYGETGYHKSLQPILSRYYGPVAQ